MINDKSIQECVASAISASDRATQASATGVFRITRAIHCNVGDTYELTFPSGGVIDMVLSSGITYPLAVENVLNASSASIDAGDITLLY